MNIDDIEVPAWAELGMGFANSIQNAFGDVNPPEGKEKTVLLARLLAAELVMASVEADLSLQGFTDEQVDAVRAVAMALELSRRGELDHDAFEQAQKRGKR